VVLALGPGSRQRKQSVILGRYTPIGWWPVRPPPPTASVVHRECEAAIAQGDLSALDRLEEGIVRAALSAQTRLALLGDRAGRSERGALCADALSAPGRSSRSLRKATRRSARCSSPMTGSREDPPMCSRRCCNEAAHGVAERRGVKDSSRRGEYHNARFRTLAEELRLAARKPRPALRLVAQDSRCQRTSAVRPDDHRARPGARTRATG
jgi:hypothetical protein